MQRLALRDVSPGVKLGASLYAEGGWTLLKAGMRLRPQHLQVIADLGYSRVVVLDDGEEPGPEFISPLVRTELEQALASCVNFLVEAWRRPTTVFTGSGRRLDAALRETLPPFVSDVCNKSSLTLPGPVRVGPAHWLDDALQGAAVAAFVGQKLNFDYGVLLRLTYGMLLRDVAQLILPPETLRRDGPLSAADWTRVRRHPRQTYDLLSALGWGDETGRLAILQHHERQDGSGYPQRLHGAPNPKRPESGEHGREAIRVVGDVAAVADVFNALNVDRPHRAAYPYSQVEAMLQEMADTTLHGAIVRELLLHWRPLGESSGDRRRQPDGERVNEPEPAPSPTAGRNVGSPRPSDQGMERQDALARLYRALAKTDRENRDTPADVTESKAPRVTR